MQLAMIPYVQEMYREKCRERWIAWGVEKGDRGTRIRQVQSTALQSGLLLYQQQELPLGTALFAMERHLHEAQNGKLW